MDPLHITEFASERYFSKLRQLNSHENTEHASSSASATITTTTAAQLPTSQPPATFSLPIGQPRHTHHEAVPLRLDDQRKRSLGHDLSAPRTQRRPSFSGSFGSLRSRVAIIPKRPSVEIPEQIIRLEGPKQYLLPETRPLKSLSQLFLSLPSELQEQIIAPLPIPSVLNLRLVSKTFHRLVMTNEIIIARYHAANTLPPYALRLYPLPSGDNANLYYLCGVWHRLHVALKLAHLITEQATKEIFLRTTEAQRLEFQPQYKRMRQRLMPLVFAMFHFFETYRSMHAQYLANGGTPLSMLPYTRNPIETQVLNMYDDQTLLKVHQVFPLVLSSFSRRLRPPSYAGRLERSIKGYLKDRPADEVYTAILVVGGLGQAQKFWATKGYNARRASVDTWYGSVARGPVEVAPKSKMSLISHLGRKKLTPVVESSNVEICSGHEARRCHSLPGDSMGGGPPMGILSSDMLRLIMSDLPALTSIWLVTAEAMILERRIVDRPQDIKRNTQVLLDLIREDTNELDENWTPGIPVTIEPPEGMSTSGSGPSD